MDSERRYHPIRRAIVFGCWLTPSVFYLAFLALAPIDILEKSELLRRFTLATQTSLQAIAPWLDLFRHAASTKFPGIAALATALAAYVTLGAAIASIVTFWPSMFDKTPTTSIPKLGTFSTIFAPPFSIVVSVWGFYCIPGDWSMMSGLTTQSRFGYIATSFFVIQLTGILSACWPVMLIDLAGRSFGFRPKRHQ